MGGKGIEGDETFRPAGITHTHTDTIATMVYLIDDGRDGGSQRPIARDLSPIP